MASEREGELASDLTGTTTSSLLHLHHQNRNFVFVCPSPVLSLLFLSFSASLSFYLTSCSALLFSSIEGKDGVGESSVRVLVVVVVVVVFYGRKSRRKTNSGRRRKEEEESSKAGEGEDEAMRIERADDDGAQRSGASEEGKTGTNGGPG